MFEVMAIKVRTHSAAAQARREKKARSGKADRALGGLVMHMHQPPATTCNDE
jgi:hypothetical protein